MRARPDGRGLQALQPLGVRGWDVALRVWRAGRAEPWRVHTVHEQGDEGPAVHEVCRPRSDLPGPWIAWRHRKLADSAAPTRPRHPLRTPGSNGGFLDKCAFNAQSVCGNPISFYALPADAGQAKSTVQSVVLPISLTGIGPFTWPATISNPDAYYAAASPAFTVRTPGRCFSQPAS